MPTYEYACRDCEEHLEVVQSFHDEALTECPACSGELRKVFSAAGIIFKGSGWHIKDYASSGSGSAPASSDTASAGGSDTKSTTKAETSTGSTGGSKASTGDSKGSSTSGKGSTSSTSSSASTPERKSA